MIDSIQLPAYPNDELENIDLPGLVDLMIANEDRVPRNAIDECARRGDAMVEQLSQLADDGNEWYGELLGDWWLKLHAVMIVGLIPTERAGLLLVKLMRRMSREKDDDLQDWLASCWPLLFHNKPESVLPALRALCEDRTEDWYIRSCATEAAVAAANHQGRDALESALEWLARMVANEEEDWEFRLSSGSIMLDIPRIQYRPLLEGMAARQRGFGAYFNQDDVQQAYAAVQDKADWESFGDPWKFYLPSEIAARTQSWAKEDARRDAKNDAVVPDRGYVYNQPVHIETYVRPEQKTGRNDPCPCGSGKKYKKCCMGKGGAGGGIF